MRKNNVDIELSRLIRIILFFLAYLHFFECLSLFLTKYFRQSWAHIFYFDSYGTILGCQKWVHFMVQFFFLLSGITSTKMSQMYHVFYRHSEFTTVSVDTE